MIIFLDIDGVMVPANSWKRPEILEDGFPAFSSISTVALNRLISYSNADILLTTSHKSEYIINTWKEIFRRRSINFNEINVLPENTNYLNRKDELLQFIKTSKLSDDFIIIDDDKSLNTLPPPIKKKLIQTSSSMGLTQSIADKALKIFKEFETV
ncbi:MAG TPA: HAD domain-containing protein [Salinimicrobium sp.]|nr:HAD domain-containing protein [Salinimicrobium sp.]